MHRTLGIAAFGLALNVTLQTTAFAQNVTVGVEHLAYFPHYAVEKNEYVGFGRAVLDAFSTESGVVFDYKPMPVARLFHAYVQGEVDFKYPDNPLWMADMKVGKNIVYSEPVVDYIDGVMVVPDRVGRPPSDIKRLGTVLGFTPWVWLPMVSSGTVALSENPDFAALLQQTLHGRIDGAYANVAVARHQLTSQLRQPDGLTFDPALPHVRDSYRLSTIKRPEVLQRFNAWIVANPQRLAELKKQYGV